MPKKGQRVEYRPKPREFVDVYLLNGFNETCLHFHAHWRTVTRWIESEGGDELRLRRIQYLEQSGYSGRKAVINRVVANRKRRAERLMAAAQCSADRDAGLVDQFLNEHDPIRLMAVADAQRAAE